MARIQELEAWRVSVEERDDVIDRMVKLFESIESGLWLFVKLGNGLKWFAGICTAIGLGWFVYHNK